ncbi:MAG TPA: hypothetical protein VMT20_07200 [Terriglobia bacterium]|nr:hypothetical protein [Terriglobia bacterium]
MSATTDSELQLYEGFTVEYRDASHRYWLLEGDDGRRAVPSVTTILGILDKPALRRWQGNLDAAAVLTLEREGKLQGVDPDGAAQIARERGLGAEARRDAAGTRGTAIHDALEAYCTEGKVPALADFPEDHKGYVQGLCAWLSDARPEPLIVERIVGSPRYGFAGRLDLIAMVGGKRLCCDLKTNRSGYYPESHAQIAGYRLTFPECGIEDVDGGMIVQVAADGSYETVEAVAGPDAFLSVLGCYRAVQDVKKALKEARR